MKNLLPMLAALAVSFATASALAQEVKGDAKAGERKNAMCVGCHGIPGYQASFPEIYRVPMISGQNARYIVAALQAYQKGERKHPSMRGIAASLSEQDMADLAAFYAAHGAPADGFKPREKPSREAPAAVAELLKKGACVSCHGESLSKPIDPSYPKLGGQHADALYVALRSYKTEGQATWGRSNGVMGGIAKQFSNAELKALANYMASLEGDLKSIPEKRFR